MLYLLSLSLFLIYTFISKAYFLQYVLGNYALQILAKLTLTGYLVFPIMLTLNETSQIDRMYLVFNFIYALVASGITASMVCVGIEAPFQTLLKLIIRDCA